jgi:hypothetical protein
MEVVSLELLLFARFRFMHLEDITPNGSIECDETNEFRDFMLEKIALYCMLSNPMSFVLVLWSTVLFVA